MEAPARPSRIQKWLCCTALGLLCALAMVLRLWNIRESLWVDELHTAWCALGGLDEVAGRAASGNQSPVFFWLEWFLIRLFGANELSLRLPSVIAGVLIVPAVFLFARRWASAGVGLVAAAQLVVDPLAIFYSTEARPYALLQLLAVVHVWLALRVMEEPTRWLHIAWIAVGALLFHLHYTAALLLAAELGLLLLVSMFGRREQRWSWLVLDTVVLGLLCLPAIGNVQNVFARRENWEFVKRSPLWTMIEWWPASLGLFFLVAALLTRRGTRQPLSVFLALLCWVSMPPLLAWISTELDLARLFFPRYLVIVQPAAALVAAWCVGFAPWRWSRWLVGGLMVAAAVWNGGIVDRVLESGRFAEARGEDWRAAMAWLHEERMSRPLPVLVESGLIEVKELAQSDDPLLREYCLYPINSLYPLEAHSDETAPLVPSDQGGLRQDVEMLTVHRGGAWLIVRGDERKARRLANAIAAQLQALSGPTGQRWSGDVVGRFEGVQIARIEAAQP